MTDMDRGLGGVTGPPWSVDLLADLHADALEPEVAAELWPKVQADPEARAILAALDATTADLSSLTVEPVPPMPADVAARIDAALQNEASSRAGAEPPNAPVVGMAEARRRRQRKIAGWGGGIFTAAAAAFALVLALGPGLQNTTEGNGVAAPGETQEAEPPMAVQRDKLGQQFSSAMGVRDYGPLDNKQKLSQCLQANGLPADIDVVGVRQVTLNGAPGVMVIVPALKEPGQMRVLVVSPQCGPGSPGKLADSTIGR